MARKKVDLKNPKHLDKWLEHMLARFIELEKEDAEAAEKAEEERAEEEPE